MNLVSVIIPYYKKKKFIRESLNSAINQSYRNLEIIIIYDDASHADLDYIKKLKETDQRISLIVNSKNFGPGASRNIGISNAKGKLIAFLDADDIWETEKIKHQVNFMEKNNLNCSHTSYKIINEDNIVIGNRKAQTFKSYEELLKSCDIGLSTVVVEQKIFSEYCKFPKLKTKEDFVLWLRILKNKNTFGAITTELCCWRNSKNSLSSSTFQKLIDGFRVYYTYMNYSFMKSLYLLLCLSLNYLKK